MDKKFDAVDAASPNLSGHLRVNDCKVIRPILDYLSKRFGKGIAQLSRITQVYINPDKNSSYCYLVLVTNQDPIRLPFNFESDSDGEGLDILNGFNRRKVSTVEIDETAAEG